MVRPGRLAIKRSASVAGRTQVLALLFIGALLVQALGMPVLHRHRLAASLGPLQISKGGVAGGHDSTGSPCPICSRFTHGNLPSPMPKVGAISTAPAFGLQPDSVTLRSADLGGNPPRAPPAV